MKGKERKGKERKGKERKALRVSLEGSQGSDVSWLSVFGLLMLEGLLPWGSD